MSYLYIIPLVLCSCAFARPQSVPTTTIKVSGRNFVIIGNKHVDKKLIEKVLSSDKTRDPQQIEWELMNTGCFESVSVSHRQKLNTTDIVLKEYPILRETSLVVHGGSKLDKKTFGLVTRLKKKDLVPQSKIRLAVEAIRFNYEAMNPSSKVEVQAMRRERYGVVDLKFIVNIEKDEQIRGVVFIGNKELSSSVLKNYLSYKKTAIYPLPILRFEIISPQELEEHKKLLERFAKAKGFLDLEVKSVTVEQRGRSRYLCIILDEGVKYSTSKIELESDCDEIDINIFRKKIALKEGDLFSMDLCDAARSAIAQELSKRKLFLYITFYRIQKDKDSGKASIKFFIKKTPELPKVGRIILKDNHKTMDSVILNMLPFKSGDVLSPLVISSAKIQMMKSGLFENVTIDTVQSSSYGSVDVLVTVQEGKTKSGQIMTSAINDFGITCQFRDKSFIKRGINFGIRAIISSNLELSSQVAIPNVNGDGGTTFYDFTVSSSSLSPSLFSTANIVDVLIDYVFAYKHPTIEQVAESSRNIRLPQDSNAKRYSLEDKLSKIWKESGGLVSISELKCMIRGGYIMPLSEHEKLTVSFGVANRSIDYSGADIMRKQFERYNSDSETDYVARGTYVQKPALRYSSNITTDKDRSATSLDDSEKKNKVKTSKYKKIGDYTLNKRTGNLVFRDYELYEADIKELDSKSSIMRLHRGVGTSPRLIPADTWRKMELDGDIGQDQINNALIREKIELTANIDYSFSKEIWGRDLTVALDTGLQFLLGTTGATKLRVKAGVIKALTDTILVTADVMFGRSINNCYLDNFMPSDLGMCRVNGPIELYSFQPLGGRSLFRTSLGISFDLTAHHSIKIKPEIKISAGSLWDSGQVPMQMDSQLLGKREWHENTLDIAQDEFTLIGLISPGVSIKFGPVMVGASFNFRIDDHNSVFNVIRPIDFSFGISA